MKNRKRSRDFTPKRSAPPPRIRAQSKPSATPETEPDPVPAQLARINEISMIARTTWFGLLAYLTFVGITLLGVEDADFFVPSRQTQLPLVNVAIPTSSFFWFAPMLGAALYAYLHLQLLKLWEALAVPGPKPGGRHLSDVIYPWLISDYAIALRPDGATRHRPLAYLSYSVTWLLVWAAGPLVLTGFWWRSMPKHDEGLTLGIAVALLVTLYIGLTSRWQACNLLWQTQKKSPWQGWVRRPMFAMLCLFTIALGWARTEGEVRLPINTTIGSLPSAQLSGDKLLPNPGNLATQTIERRRFRKEWCNRQGIDLEICGRLYSGREPAPDHIDRRRLNWCAEVGRALAPPDCRDFFKRLDDEFREEWRHIWLNRISALGNLDLSGADLRGANLQEAFLIGANLSNARLQNANLQMARLEGSRLVHAIMKRVFMSGARLESADLCFVNMKDISLQDAYLEDANFYAANIDGRNIFDMKFNRAKLDGVSFSGADLKMVDFREASLEGADFYMAKLEHLDLSAAHLLGASFRSVDLKNVHIDETFKGVSVREADLTSERFTQDIINNLFGDKKTVIAEGLSRPEHWDTSTLQPAEYDDPKFDAWLTARGWSSRPRPHPNPCDPR